MSLGTSSSKTMYLAYHHTHDVDSTIVQCLAVLKLSAHRRLGSNPAEMAKTLRKIFASEKQ